MQLLLKRAKYSIVRGKNPKDPIELNTTSDKELLEEVRIFAKNNKVT